jgi:hypothetical protein
MNGCRSHLVMTRTQEDGDDPLCDCGMHDWDTKPHLFAADAVAWSDVESDPPESKHPRWRRALPWAAVATLVCGTAAACLAASSPGVTSSTVSVTSAKPVDMASTVSAPPPTTTITVAAPPPAPVTDSVTAVPAVAPDDRWLIDVMTDDGFIITDPPAVVEQVHHACALLRDGETPRQADRDMAASMHTTVPAAAVLVAEAQSLYADDCGKGR